jgi:hypothetical protein
MMEWTALLIAASSLLIALLTFYRVELRGPSISVRPPLANQKQYRPHRGTWTGGFPSPQVMDVQLLIINEGARAGVLESFTVKRLEFMPHQPRILRAEATQLWHPGPRKGLAVELPAAVRDGDIIPAYINVSVSAWPPPPEAHLDQVAHDLRELTGIRVHYTYSSWRRRMFGGSQVVETRAQVDVGLEELRAAALKVFGERDEYKSALDILKT